MHTGERSWREKRAIEAVDVAHLILRTSWVYGTRGRNFLRTVLDLAKTREELRMVDDHIGAPTWCRTIAEATTQALAQLYSPFAPRATSIADLSGVYHFTASGETSWFGFAQAIVRQMHLDGIEGAPQICHTSAQYPLPAARLKIRFCRRKSSRGHLSSRSRLESCFGTVFAACCLNPYSRRS